MPRLLILVRRKVSSIFSFNLVQRSMNGIAIIVGCIVSASLHFFVIKLDVVPAGKTESNYFSNRARLQHASAQRSADVAFVGSSITGRLPCQDTNNLMNLGFDGDTSMQGLIAMKSGIFKKPSVCFVEVNRLISSAHSNEKIALTAIDKLAESVLNAKSDNRPSSLIYRALYHWKSESSCAANLGEPFLMKFEKPNFDSYDSRQLKQLEKFRHIVKVIQSLSDKTRFILVFYPVGYHSIDWPAGSPDDGRLLASALQLEFLDLHHTKFDNPLRFSDSTHLDEQSARFVRDCLMRTINHE